MEFDIYHTNTIHP